MEALSSENARLRVRVEQLERLLAAKDSADEAEVRNNGIKSSAHLFYNDTADLARLVDEVAELRQQVSNRANAMRALERENEELRARFRVTSVVMASPSRYPSRDPVGRKFDDRDVVVARLEVKVRALETALAAYGDAAQDRERRRVNRKRQDANERRKLAGPVDLTVAWRPKKNEISERTNLLAKRAARRRRAREAERKVIELEQRDIILGRYAKAEKAKAKRETNKQREYQRIRQERILQLTREEQRRELELCQEEEECKYDD